MRRPGNDQSGATGMTFDFDQRVVRIGERAIGLTAAELRLLKALFEHEGRPLRRDQLVDVLTEGNAVVQERTVDVHVCALRRKIDIPGLIETVPNVGYRVQLAHPKQGEAK